MRPTLAGTSIGFAMHNANKRSAVLNPLDESDRRRFLTSPPAPTSSSTVVFRDRPPRTGHRVPSWPIATDTWWRCRSPTLALPVRGRHGARPIRCCTR